MLIFSFQRIVCYKIKYSKSLKCINLVNLLFLKYNFKKLSDLKIELKKKIFDFSYLIKFFFEHLALRV